MGKSNFPTIYDRIKREVSFFFFLPEFYRHFLSLLKNFFWLMAKGRKYALFSFFLVLGFLFIIIYEKTMTKKTKSWFLCFS